MNIQQLTRLETVRSELEALKAECESALNQLMAQEQASQLDAPRDTTLNATLLATDVAQLNAALAVLKI